MAFCIFEFHYYYKNSLIPEKSETIISGNLENLPEQVVTESTITETISGSNDSRNIEGSYSYLFEENEESNTSNIVGYFAHGAFAWYVPNWLVNNWEMKPFRTEGMMFSPKVRATPLPGQQYDFSDIEFDISTSTELNNAYNFYLTTLNSIPKDEVIINEILLNKSTMDMVNIQMENNTRIYHITAYTRDFKRITDIYFMDGNGKTLDLRIETKKEIFSQFSNKIRDMVEGIGELKAPQG